MRLLLISLLLTLGWAGQSHAAITFFWDCEDTATFDGDPNYSSGDTTVATGTGTPTNSATAVKVGTNGCLIDAAGEYFVFDNTVAPAIASPTDIAVGFWIQWPSAFPATAIFYQIRGSNGSNFFNLMRVSTDELRFRVRSATGPTTVDVDSTDANITVGNWYFVVTSLNAATDTATLAIYDTSGVAVGSSPWTGTVTVDPTEFGSTTGIQWGERGGISATYYIDNIFVGAAGDASCIHSNRDITTYTAYTCAGSAAPRGLLLGVYP